MFPCSIMKQAACKTVKRKWRFRGIGSDAITLGVNERTLRRALTGEWKLPKLKARYEALKQTQQLTPKNMTTSCKSRIKATAANLVLLLCICATLWLVPAASAAPFQTGQPNFVTVVSNYTGLTVVSNTTVTFGSNDVSLAAQQQFTITPNAGMSFYAQFVLTNAAVGYWLLNFDTSDNTANWTGPNSHYQVWSNNFSGAFVGGTNGSPFTNGVVFSLTRDQLAGHRLIYPSGITVVTSNSCVTVLQLLESKSNQ